MSVNALVKSVDLEVQFFQPSTSPPASGKCCYNPNPGPTLPSPFPASDNFNWSPLHWDFLGRRPVSNVSWRPSSPASPTSSSTSTTSYSILHNIPTTSDSSTSSSLDSSLTSSKSILKNVFSEAPTSPTSGSVSRSPASNQGPTS